VLSYLLKTKHLGIRFDSSLGSSSYQCDPPLDFDAYAKSHGMIFWSDGSYGTAHSHGGHVGMIANGPVCWASRSVKVTCTSSQEAEICAGVSCAKDMKFVRRVWNFLRMLCPGRIPLMIDNEAMWFAVRNPGVSRLTRHYELWQQFVREQYLKAVLSVHLTPTNYMAADIFTKAMPKIETDYEKFRNYVMNIAK